MLTLFPIGEPVEGALCTPLKHVGGEPGPSFEYWVRYGCCGAEGSIRHSGIRSRRARKSKHCRACYDHGIRLREINRQKRDENRGPEPLAWPAPPSAVKRSTC